MVGEVTLPHVTSHARLAVRELTRERCHWPFWKAHELVRKPTCFVSVAQYRCWVLRSGGDSTSPTASTSRLIS
jgi:hypothetical protein